MKRRSLKMRPILPKDKTVPYDPQSFEMRDSWKPRRTPRELMPKKPGWE